MTAAAALHRCLQVCVGGGQACCGAIYTAAAVHVCAVIAAAVVAAAATTAAVLLLSVGLQLHADCWGAGGGSCNTLLFINCYNVCFVSYAARRNVIVIKVVSHHSKVC